MASRQEEHLRHYRPLWRIAGFLPFIGVAFLNAMLDLGHKILIQNTLFKSYDGPEQVLLTAVVNALILLPFIMLFTPAGFLSDRYSKPKVMRVSAAVAVVLTFVITLCYYQGWFIPAFAMTFLLAMQSALYSPAKYGYIRELVGSDNLSGANGWVQAATIIAILGAIVLFSLLFELRLEQTTLIEHTPEQILRQVAPLGWLLVVLALIEWLMALRLGTGVAQPELKLDRREYLSGRLLKRNLSRIYRHRPILWSVLGLALFWSISQVMVAVYPAYVKAHLGELNTFLIQGAMALAGVGILCGSIFAASVSRHHINTGLVPAGALIVTLGLALLPVSQSLGHAAILFFAIGLGGAMTIVPLNALIQFHAPEGESGSILAGNNFLQNVAMFSCLLGTVASAFAEVPARILLVVLALSAAAGAVLAFVRLPEALLRLLVRMLMRNRYRLEVLGFEHMPADGKGVLLLGNHISWLDWAIVQLACPRHVHFVMERSIYERRYLKWLLDLYRVIPISPASSRDAMARVAALLQKGEVVCLFPEGAISYSGQLAPFKQGFERIAREVDADQVEILPFYLRGLWGSRFSRSNARLKDARRAGWKRDVIVAFGEPMAVTASAVDVRQAVSILSIKAWEAYTDTLPTLPRAFVRTAREAPSEWALADLNGPALSHLRVLTGCALLRRRLKRCQGQRVAVLLPSAPGGVIGTLALMMSGRTLVPLNYTAPVAVLERCCERAGVETVVTSRQFIERLEQRGIDMKPLLAKLSVIELESLKQSIGQLESVLTLLQVRLMPVALLERWLGGRRRLDDTAAILFSSGSEGEPKGVMLSHRNIMANLKQIADVFNIRDDDCVLGTLPLFHAFGLTATTMMPLIEGVPLVCHPDPTDAVNVGKAVARWRATLLCGTSTFLRLYTRQSRLIPAMFESLRLVVAGAEKLSPQVREQFESRFHKTVLEGYGCTETTPVASVNLPDYLDTSYWTLQVGNKPGTVGMALPGSWFSIVDPESLEPLPVGESGMVLIGGTQIMRGYLDDPERTRRVIIERDGVRWYVSGDKGYLDTDGFLTLVDRYSRFIKVGGEMISLGAVEEHARQILAAEVELMATSVPDRRKGEQVVLLVGSEEAGESDALAAELRQRLIDGGMPGLMLPARVFVLPYLPCLGSGKPDLKGAKQTALDLIGMDSSQ
ncbi:MFS transporter [Marinobacterium sp. D7]|uniref:acyl-[ACP]--phospholipid O-acyltransferase n=1 Tax=Marinobacterium ramblicola TaxID=2849041 RepID=UPI001C2DC5AD|nr:acyl-[ACP]--phospholipid O-acyltransferase [Marinobacterium ramblicola]MBV1788597.1 MFS transporter [Marinobacterium ramblicola]